MPTAVQRIALQLMALCAVLQLPLAHSGKPNVLLFHADDLLSHYMGLPGAAATPPGLSLPVASGLTPHIDRLRSEGATFLRLYGASSMCAPSRLSLLTGRYPSRGAYASAKAGAKATKVTVPDSVMTGADSTHNLPRALKAACGYTTGAAGKWHLSPSSEAGANYKDAYALQQASVKARPRRFQY